MYGLAIYSLKVGACLAVFYLFFKLLLSRETLHRFNRMVVLGVILLSFVLPLCVITVTREYPVLPELFILPSIPTVVAEAGSVPKAEPFPWEMLVGCLYLAGVLSMLIATGVSVERVLRLVRSGRREKLENGFVLVRLQQAATPFSWWRYIVISEADYADCGDEIITHETAHLRLHHSWDLLATDVAGCLQWFNPAMWLLRHELRAIHEYEADEAVLNSGADARQYQLLLIKKAAGGRWYSIANSFNHSKLKNRITMMLQKKSSRWAGAKALFVVPLAGLALGAFSQTVYVPMLEDKNKQNSAIEELFAEESDKQITIRVQVIDSSGQPMAGVAVCESGTTRGTVTDYTGSAELQIDESSSVELLMVGYESVRLTCNKGKVAMSGAGTMQSEGVADGIVAVRVQMLPDKPVAPGTAIASTAPGTAMASTPVSAAGKTSRSSNMTIQVDKSNGGRILLHADGKKVDTDACPPLYIVDGQQVKSLSEVPNNRIETVTVQKDPRALQPYIEKYGDKAKNGVILITLKKEGDPTPVYVVDGQLIESLNEVPSNRIKTVTVQKDPRALQPYIEKYGDKAKNGVILITLKGGRPDSGFPERQVEREIRRIEQEIAEMDAYLQSDEWKKKVEELDRKSAEMDAYLQSDEWKKKVEELDRKSAEMDAYLQSDEWKKKVEELDRKSAEMDAYLQSDEWKKKVEELDKKSAEMDAYFQSDEWKKKVEELDKKSADVEAYFQSDEWKEQQRTLNEGLRLETDTANGTKIIFIDGKQATEADLKALDEKRIQSVIVNKDKQPDGSVVSTITVTTKDKKQNKTRRTNNKR